MGLLLLLLIGIAAGGYLVLFSLANTDTVYLTLPGGWYLLDVALWEIMVVGLAIGLAVALVLMTPAQWRARTRARDYRRELDRAHALLAEAERQAPTPVSAVTRAADAEPAETTAKVKPPASAKGQQAEADKTDQ